MLVKKDRLQQQTCAKKNKIIETTEFGLFVQHLFFF